MVFLHFADFQDSKIRQFNVYFNNDSPLLYTPLYLAADYVYSVVWYSSTNGKFNITLVATAKSLLPPMLNAYEIYTLIAHSTPTTFSKDCKEPFHPPHTKYVSYFSYYIYQRINMHRP